jgi:protein transport protein SEC61 subunit gamma and related proteins
MEQTNKRKLGSKIRSFVIQCKRVLKITKKPSKEEFKIIVKVSGIGILLIGAMGFIIYLLWTLLS